MPPFLPSSWRLVVDTHLFLLSAVYLFLYLRCFCAALFPCSSPRLFVSSPSFVFIFSSFFNKVDSHKSFELGYLAPYRSRELRELPSSLSLFSRLRRRRSLNIIGIKALVVVVDFCRRRHCPTHNLIRFCFKFDAKQGKAKPRQALHVGPATDVAAVVIRRRRQVHLDLYDAPSISASIRPPNLPESSSCLS